MMLITMSGDSFKLGRVLRRVTFAPRNSLVVVIAVSLRSAARFLAFSTHLTRFGRRQSALSE
jgi:hypothetical protein